MKDELSPFYYLNEDHTATPCSIEKWRVQFETIERHVADNIINDMRISTVWLGTPHGFNYSDEPLLFETMIFPKKSLGEEYCMRYATWDEAVEGHRRAIQWVLDGCKDD